jgi:hypothetical protein
VARSDPLFYFFNHFFEIQNLIDVELVKIVPTQRNGRKGREGISKRLDRFIFMENIMEESVRIMS